MKDRRQVAGLSGTYGSARLDAFCGDAAKLFWGGARSNSNLSDGPDVDDKSRPIQEFFGGSFSGYDIRQTSETKAISSADEVMHGSSKYLFLILDNTCLTSAT